MDQIIRIGMDTSKHVFQLHGVNAAEEPVLRRKLRRHDVEAFFTKLPPTVVGIEACGASHHWARLLQSLAPGGVLAIQMPDNRDEPTHRLMREVAAEPTWAAAIGDCPKNPVLSSPGSPVG